MTRDEFSAIMDLAAQTWPAYAVSTNIGGAVVSRMDTLWDTHRGSLTTIDPNTLSSVVMQAMDNRGDGYGKAPPFSGLMERAVAQHRADNADKLDNWRKPADQCPAELRSVTTGFCKAMMVCGLDAEGYKRRAKLTHALIKRRIEINYPMSPEELKRHQKNIHHYEAEADRLDPKPIKEAVA